MSSDRTGGIPSPTEIVVDRNRRWSPVWYPWIKRLLDTVKSNAASIFTVQETIDEINGKWSISINANDRVAGMITLDASQSLSSFSVLADKFIVVHPSANGTTIQAFIVGLVNGVSTVGVNGNLIVDGTILARHIDVTSLSAITANVGTVTAGVLRSADSNFVIDLDNKTLTITT